MRVVSYARPRLPKRRPAPLLSLRGNSNGALLLSSFPTPTPTPPTHSPAARPRSYGYLTWEWRAGIRGWAHPLLFAAQFSLLRALGLHSSPLLLRVAPRVLQARPRACRGGGYLLRVHVSGLCPRRGVRTVKVQSVALTLLCIPPFTDTGHHHWVHRRVHICLGPATLRRASKP